MGNTLRRNTPVSITDLAKLSEPSASAPGSSQAHDSYKFAYDDELELLKPDLLLREMGIENTVVVFGSTRFHSSERAAEMLAQATTPAEKSAAEKAQQGTHFYESAKRFGGLVAQYNLKQEANSDKLVICTGGGPGIMEAANRGAFEMGDLSIGFNISLPREQTPNPYLTPGLSVRFHYFALRKMHFMMQTNKVERFPIILVCKSFWDEVLGFQKLIDYGVIDAVDLQLIHFVDSAQEAWDYIAQWYELN
jgi:predicted Rossmann-fold nucleotide-binding protein